MKVLHLGYNVASQISVAVRSLRGIGVNARGMVPGHSQTAIVSSDAVEVVSAPRSGHSPAVMAEDILRCARVMRMISWADVLHWHFGTTFLPRELDLKWTTWLRKPGVAEFWGSDIRISKIEETLNPQYHCLPADYREELTETRSRAMQSAFAATGLECLLPCASLEPFVRPDCFPRVHFLRQRMILADYLPQPPDPQRKRPMIVHSPSNPKIKGTREVIEVIGRLRKNFDFDFRLIENVPHAQALSMLAEADIFIDQLYIGSHGLAALEAMALAKPTVCYLTPRMQRAYPSKLPLLNAAAENLAEVIETLITNPPLRHDIGVRSRAYVEEHHDAARLAPQLVAIYRQAIEHRRVGTRFPIREASNRTVD